MTANPLERAVIDAARFWRRATTTIELSDRALSVRKAVEALEAWEAGQDPEVREIGWHEVAEGDALKSVKNGKFYPVLSTLKVRGGYRITIALGPGRHTAITRPTPEEPSAFVKRGQAGAAVDIFVDVFSSGGK